MKKALALSLGFGLLSFNFVLAQTYNLPGQSIDVAPGSANINYPGAGTGTNVQQGTTGSTVNTPGRSTQAAPGSVQTNVGGVFNIDVNGKNVQFTANEGLGVQVGKGLSSDQKSALISLTGGAEVLIQSDNDLETYKSLVVDECDGIKTISTPGNTVVVEYRQPAKLLGVFNSNLNATVEVDDSGTVDIKLPWYSFLYKKDTTQVKASIEANMNASTTQVNSNGASVTIQKQAKTISVITSAVSVNVTPCATTVTNNNAQTPTPAPAPTPSPTPTPTSTSSSFVGTWNGTFSKYPAASSDCVVSGTTKFVVNANGNVTLTTTGAGVTITGTGKVDANGNFTGSWNYMGQSSTYSGKFTGTSGSGTYGNNFDCSGTWSVTKS